MAYYLVVGLGNPGPKYAGNRHNVGFRCVERLAEAHDLSFDRRQGRAWIASDGICGKSVILARPRTFMNESGHAVALLVDFYNAPLARVMLVYDDLDLPLGTLRMRPSGGSGGHRGTRSVIEQLDSQAFPRLRIGIGHPPGRMDPADYVLRDFSADEEPLVGEVVGQAVAAIEAWLRDGIEAAMSRYNRSV